MWCRIGGQGGAGQAASPPPEERARWGQPRQGGGRPVHHWMGGEGSSH